MRTVFYICLVILLTSLGVAFWPYLQSPRFWVGTGIVVGLAGTFISWVAMGHKDQDH